MRTTLLWLFLPMMTAAQVTVQVAGVTATQALLQIHGAASPCTIELREGAVDGPPHPDVIRSVDIRRPDTISRQDGARIVTLGHRRSNLALAADTEYVGIISGCGEGTFRFRTQLPPLGATMTMPLPVNDRAWDNADFPQVDFSPSGRDKWYVDPMTGVKLKLVNRPEDFSRKRQTDDAFPFWAGGTGWVNAANAADGSPAKYATSSTTTPLFLYAHPVFPYQSYQALENIGVIVYGSCSGGSSADDCAVELGITTNPAEGFAGTPIRVVLPAGPVVKVRGGSSHEAANGAFPTAYPQPLFAGWGGARIYRDQFVLPNAATFSSAEKGVLKINNPDVNTHFQKSLRDGHHIWVQDSGCSANGAPDICTISSAGDAGAVTLAEKDVSAAAGRFRAFPWGIMVRKVTAFGTVNIGFKYRWAASANVTTGPGEISCGEAEVSDSDGVKGHPCVTGGLIYFISNDGEVVRPVMALGSPPEFGPQFTGQKPAFSATEANVLYVTDFTGSNLYKLTYRGNWKDSPWDTDARRYHINGGGDYPAFDENVDWKLAIRPNLGAQVAELYPEYAAPPYRSWASGALFGGVSGDIAVFYKALSGQDGGPCHVAVVNLKTGRLTDMFSTLDDGGAAAWGNCHSVQASSVAPNTVGLSLNILNLNDRNRITGGPYRMPVEAVMVNGEWVGRKGLPWPVDDSYDNRCPADLAAEYTGFGATGNQCVTLLTSGHPCNIAPSSLETNNESLYPACTWNSGYRMGPPLRPGHSFVDVVSGGSAPGDSEHFRVLSVEEVPDSGGKLKVIAQRNASRDYCCIGYPRCVASPSQQTHLAGFTALLVPGSKASCNSSMIAVQYPDGTRATKQRIELSRTYQGHSAIGRGPAGTLRYIAGQGAITMPDMSWLGIQPPIDSMKVANPTFQGVAASIGMTLQQYLDHSQWGAPDEKTVYSFDANAINPSYGIGGGNNFGSGVQGSNRSLTHVSGDVWRTTAVGRVDYKVRPLIGWSAQKILKDVSGPSSNIAAAAQYSFCYAYRAGECQPDAPEGAVYVKVPNVYRHADNNVARLCQTAMIFAQVPCVFSSEPSAGYVRQFRTDRPDPKGSDQRLITTGLRPYGTHYPYWATVAHPAGDLVLLMSGGWIQGIRESVLLAKLPPYPDLPEQRNTYGGLTVNVAPQPGVTHARVRFGYNTEFHCTERAEACLTDERVAPFAFASESESPTACSNGCSIEAPAIAGRLVYYRVETYNGSVWANGETAVAAVAQTEAPPAPRL